MPTQTIATDMNLSDVAPRAQAHPDPSGSIQSHTQQGMTMNNDNRKLDTNRDPLTGAPGVHPVGTVIGAVVGGLAS